MSGHRPRVMIADGGWGGTRDAVVGIRALTQGGYDVFVAASRPHSPPTLSRYVAGSVQVPETSAEEFAPALEHEMARLGCVAFLPAAERVIHALKPTGWQLADKTVLAARAAHVGIPTVPEVRFGSVSEIQNAASGLAFPVVVKPSIRSFKAFRADDLDTIRAKARKDVELLVQPFLAGRLGAIAGVMWGGAVHSASQEEWERIWPRDCGLPTLAVSQVPDVDQLDRLGALMTDFEGIFVAQFIGRHLIDLNLRLHSTLPLSVSAGVNIPTIYAHLVSGRTVDSSFSRPGARCRWISGEVKGLGSDLSARRAPPGGWWSVAPRRGTVHSMFSLRDPMPFLARLRDRTHDDRT